MQIKNKTFYLILIVSFCICAILGLFIRSSIKKFEFSDLKNIDDECLYNPFNDTEYSNGTYPNVKEINNLDSIYKYIVIGKTSGNREVLEGAVLTEIEVSKVLKGEVKGEKIKVYEPVDIVNNMICSFDGYNLLKENKEYILCLNDLKEGVKEYDENKIKLYNYSSTFFGKFPLKYTDDEFKVTNTSADSKEMLKYGRYKNCEQVFQNEVNKKIYLNEYNRLLNLYN
ncbi:hypothetical protein [uncultured Clostridium sp.]|uniref:hypothetical protein n=1 Tax=uncultured Clostridium sp. TaxID=59620 RepID=UPI0025D5B429|nr:hypothetical protein [uncultured Clostridium sp.]